MSIICRKEPFEKAMSLIPLPDLQTMKESMAWISEALECIANQDYERFLDHYRQWSPVYSSHPVDDWNKYLFISGPDSDEECDEKLVENWVSTHVFYHSRPWHLVAHHCSQKGLWSLLLEAFDLPSFQAFRSQCLPHRWSQLQTEWMGQILIGMSMAVSRKQVDTNTLKDVLVTLEQLNLGVISTWKSHDGAVGMALRYFPQLHESMKDVEHTLACLQAEDDCNVLWRTIQGGGNDESNGSPSPVKRL